MAKELPYFRFTATEWLTDDISEQDYETKGLFADVCAFYWFKDCTVKKERLFDRFSNATLLLEQLFSKKIVKLKHNDFVEITFLDLQYDLLSEKRKKRQNSGKLGGLAKSSNATAMLQQKPSYKDKDKDNDKDKLLKRTKFIPPTLFDVETIIAEKKYRAVNPEAFWNHYEGNGWKVGKNKMKNWKATLAGWESRNKENLGKEKRSFAKQDDDVLAEIMDEVNETHRRIQNAKRLES